MYTCARGQHCSPSEVQKMHPPTAAIVGVCASAQAAQHMPVHHGKTHSGVLRESNSGPLAPEARIIPLDQAPSSSIDDENHPQRIQMHKRRGDGGLNRVRPHCLILIGVVIGVSITSLALFFLHNELSPALSATASQAAASSSLPASPFASVDHLLAAIRENAPESFRDRCLAIVEGKEGSLDASFSQVRFLTTATVVLECSSPFP